MPPTIGLVVPNYNGNQFLAECLDSILAQEGVTAEVLVMDGGSNDGSQETARAYGPRVRVVSQRDGGQADAIRRGFEQLDTELVGWLNSDDKLLPSALRQIVAAAEGAPKAVLFHGHLERVDGAGRLIEVATATPIDHEILRAGRGRTLQPGSFYRAWAVQACGGVDPSFHLLMDVDLWTRLTAFGPAKLVDASLAQFRVHAAAKSSQAPWKYYQELLRLGFKHERDRLGRATARRLIRVVSNQVRYQISRAIG